MKLETSVKHDEHGYTEITFCDGTKVTIDAAHFPTIEGNVAILEQAIFALKYPKVFSVQVKNDRT